MSDPSNAHAVTADWIAADWGTTNLRVWAMAGDRAVASAVSAKGMGGLERQEFEPALLQVIAGWLAPGRVTDIVACGMVGARQGWIEAGYEQVPGPPLAARRTVVAPSADPRIRVRILHGLSQAAPADVMRGEETQIAGFLAGAPGFDGVICLPGTHSKWARCGRGVVTGFTTFMTGELFSLIGRQSVLRHNVAESGWSEPAFVAAVEEALQRPRRVAAALFGLRAGALVGSLDPVEARARLSGLLIGSELAAAKDDWQGREIMLIGAEAQSKSYAAALAVCGVASRTMDVAAMTLAGLTAAHSALQAHEQEPS